MFLRREHYVFIGLQERIQMKNTVDCKGGLKIRNKI